MIEPEMNDLARQLLNLLAQFTTFALPILTAQCKYAKKSLSSIERDDLIQLAPYIGRAIALFSNPKKGQDAEDAIRALAAK